MTQPVQLVPDAVEESTSKEALEHQQVNLETGQTVSLEIRRSEQGITLDAQAPLTLTITMEANGPRVELQNASLTIGATDELVLEADKLKLKGNESCRVETGGDIDLKAAGEMRLTSERDCVVKSEVIHLN